MYMYMYMYMCVCVCVCVFKAIFFRRFSIKNTTPFVYEEV